MDLTVGLRLDAVYVAVCVAPLLGTRHSGVFLNEMLAGVRSWLPASDFSTSFPYQYHDNDHQSRNLYPNNCLELEHRIQNSSTAFGKQQRDRVTKAQLSTLLLLYSHCNHIANRWFQGVQMLVTYHASMLHVRSRAEGKFRTGMAWVREVLACYLQKHIYHVTVIYDKEWSAGKQLSTKELLA